MQALTNDNYSEIKLYSVSLIEYKAIEFSIKKKNQPLHSRSQYWNDNEAATDHGGFVHKANAVNPHNGTWYNNIIAISHP